ncbi:MAG: tRNA (adenosine(37)-N6)-dimethylallyltransferase MiaA [Minisyncoccia bacterium]
MKQKSYVASPLQKIVIIVGPTASGKTALAIALAKKFGGEVISADSRQVYKELTIGSAKVSKKEMSGVRHHLLDVRKVTDPAYTAHDFYTEAHEAIERIGARSHLPIIAGGTGFYTDVLSGRITLPGAAPDMVLREKLELKSLPQLLALLKRRSPQRHNDIVQKNEIQNKRRIIRALEVSYSPDAEKSTHVPYDILWIGMQLDKELLKNKIYARNTEMFPRGLVREGKKLRTLKISDARIKEFGFEYLYLNEYLRGAMTKEEALTWMNIKTWQYAKRQMTYWKRNNDIIWFDPKNTTAIQKTLQTFLKRGRQTAP